MQKKQKHQILPKHIAIIMDGNGRWAKKYLMHRSAGHRAGAEALRRLTEQMNNDGFKILTVYAFSTENWQRSEDEVSFLMGLVHEYIAQYIADAKKNNIKMRVLGDISKLSEALQSKINNLIDITKNKDGLLLNIAINYGGRDEILRACKKLCHEVVSSKIYVDGITEATFESYLDTQGLPNPDLIIRTSGEMRLSNFLLWQAAYAEFYTTDTLWPDFKIKHIYEALEFYNNRERRFGKRK